MGASSSVLKRETSPFLSTHAHFDGANRLAKNKSFRLALADFIKSGLWIESLLRYEAPGEPTPEECLAVQKDSLLYLYAPEKNKLAAYDELMNAGRESQILSMLTSITRMDSTISVAPPKRREGPDNFLQPEQLRSLMVHIAFSVFLRSSEYQRFLKFGRESGQGYFTDVDCDERDSWASSKLSRELNPYSAALQEVLCGCAAYFDEEVLAESLANPQWLSDVSSCVDEYFLGITVCDASDGCMVYANRAYAGTTGYSQKELIGKGLGFLSGAETDREQLASLERHMREGIGTAKASITLYSRGGWPFLDLVAERRVADEGFKRKTKQVLVVQVHCTATRTGTLEDLSKIDELLAILTHVVSAPEPLPLRRPSVAATLLLGIQHTLSRSQKGLGSRRLSGSDEPNSAQSVTTPITHMGNLGTNMATLMETTGFTSDRAKGDGAP
mmetsp:Transcript_14776/g.32618  ORF Transcript_14776/g.32618 Transcript_14776/m.32618 type:complete len:444 (-) Transcript_14776:76-1407(-)